MISALIMIVVLVLWWREDVYNSGWHDGFKSAEQVIEGKDR